MLGFVLMTLAFDSKHVWLGTLALPFPGCVTLWQLLVLCFWNGGAELYLGPPAVLSSVYSSPIPPRS